jgi:hypothetical protein
MRVIRKSTRPRSRPIPEKLPAMVLGTRIQKTGSPTPFIADASMTSLGIPRVEYLVRMDGNAWTCSWAPADLDLFANFGTECRRILGHPLSVSLQSRGFGPICKAAKARRRMR